MDMARKLYAFSKSVIPVSPPYAKTFCSRQTRESYRQPSDIPKGPSVANPQPIYVIHHHHTYYVKRTRFEKVADYFTIGWPLAGSAFLIWSAGGITEFWESQYAQASGESDRKVHGMIHNQSDLLVAYMGEVKMMITAINSLAPENMKAVFKEALTEMTAGKDESVNKKTNVK